MNRFILSFLTVCSVVSLNAQKKAPKWIDKAGNAIIKIETTTKDGKTKTGNGFFISEKGEAVSNYKLFLNAVKATATAANGEKFEVSHILGADDMYGVIRFNVIYTKKTPFLNVTKTPPATGAFAYIPAPSEEKKYSSGSISEITKINGTFNYYRVEMPLPASQQDFPLLNDAGEVFAMTQADATGKGKTYGISVEYINSIKINSTDMLKRTYSDIGIRKAWAQSADESQLALLLYASQQDAPTYLETINDYISTFPNIAEGYTTRASHYAYHRKELAQTEAEQKHLLDLALEDIKTASKYSKQKGEYNYNLSKLIFGVAAADSTLQENEWNINAAKENIEKAIAEEDLPVYRQLEGDIAFYQGDFEKAYNSYSFVNKSDLASPTTYYLAAKSKQQIPGANLMEVVSLIDSAAQKSAGNEAMAYLLESVDLKMQLGLYDNAVKDYDKYFNLSGGNVNAQFYYYREQAKFRANDLEGALKDIEKANLFDNNNAIYQAEEASIYLRMKDPSKAQGYAEKAIALQADFASAHRILGVCLLRQDKKDEACKSFAKAKELGDIVAEKLIKENCK